MSAITTAILVAGCVAQAAAPSTTTTTSSTIPTTTTTTSSTTSTTSTTIPPFTLDGAPEQLTAVVESFYEFFAGERPQPPPAAEGVIASLVPGSLASPPSGAASVGTFRGQSIATVTVGHDLLLGVDDGSGWRIVGGSWPDVGVTLLGPSPRLVAVIGSDARPGENPTRARADSIHIVGLDGSGKGAVVGIPRDSYVPVPGIGRRKINAALSLGGPETLMATLRDLTGLPIEGYVLTGFEGFQEMVGNVLGGMDIHIPFAISDSAAGAFFSAGLQYLNGPNALALARPRKTLPGGDFARSELQGLLLVGAVGAVQAKGMFAIPSLLEGSDPWFYTDLTAEQLLTFAVAAGLTDLTGVPNVVVPGRSGSAGGASVVHIGDGAAAIFSDLADGRLDG